MTDRVFKLRDPFEYGGVPITELRLTTQPKAKHLRKLPLEAETMEDFMPLIAALGGYSEDLIDEVGYQDLLEMVSFIGSIMGNAPSAKLTLISQTSQ